MHKSLHASLKDSLDFLGQDSGKGRDKTGEMELYKAERLEWISIGTVILSW